MASTEFASLNAQIEKLDTFFITRGKNPGDYTSAEHAQATAFLLLASAHIENYVEARCRAVATQGIERLRKGQPTATGRSLAVWFLTGRGLAQEVPIHESDVTNKLNFCDEIARAYAKSVASSHGIDDKDFYRLVYPLGLREASVPAGLGLSLGTLADRRNKASHSYVNRAKSLSAPSTERDFVDQIIADLEVVDKKLGELINHFPIPK